MRILIVTQYFWPENFRINDLVSGLKQRGHEILVVTGKPNYPSGEIFPEFREAPRKFANYDGVEVIRVPMLRRAQGALRLFFNYLSFVVGASLWGPWLLRRRKFDVVFAYEPSPITVALPAILFARLKKAPLVLWVQDLWPETLAAVDAVRSPFLLRCVGYLVQFIYKCCTLVLGQSRAFVEAIGKYCFDKSKIHYYPNYSEDVFNNGFSEKAPEVPEQEGSFNIVLAGNIGEAQDIPAVLAAAEKLKSDPRIRWLIVGDGHKSPWLADEVERLGIEKSVLLLGRHFLERMPSFYAHADALLVSLKIAPAFSRTIPAKIQTYLMSGIPILGMLDGEGAAVIEQANAGLTCPAGDFAALAAAVQKLAAMDESERRIMGKNGRRYAKLEFGREMLLGKLEGFFEKAAVIYSNRGK